MQLPGACGKLLQLPHHISTRGGIEPGYQRVELIRLLGHAEPAQDVYQLGKARNHGLGLLQHGDEHAGELIDPGVDLACTIGKAAGTGKELVGAIGKPGGAVIEARCAITKLARTIIQPHDAVIEPRRSVEELGRAVIERARTVVELVDALNRAPAALLQLSSALIKAPRAVRGIAQAVAQLSKSLNNLVGVLFGNGVFHARLHLRNEAGGNHRAIRAVIVIRSEVDLRFFGLIADDGHGLLGKVLRNRHDHQVLALDQALFAVVLVDLREFEVVSL